MRRPNKFGKALIGVFGLLLVLFMTVEVAHSHPAGSPDVSMTAHCKLCATAHIAVASQPSWLTEHVLYLIGKLAIGEPDFGSRTVVFTAFIRPPPVEAAFA